MDERAIAELRMLRRRAYGPAPDIEGDAVARSRLLELEELIRQADADGKGRRPALATIDAGRPAWRALDDTGREAQHPRSGSGGDATEPVREASAPVGEAAVAVGEASVPVATAPPRRRIGRGVTALWAASLVAMGIVASLWALTVAAPEPLTAGTRHVATLQVDPTFEWPQIFGTATDGSQGFDSFEGLTLASFTQYWASEVGTGCLMVVVAGDIVPGTEYFGSVFPQSCGAGAFPATVEIVVAEELPEQLRARFPDGSALQFVLDGSTVEVFSDAP